LYQFITLNMNRLRNVRLPVPRAPVLKRKMSNWFEKNIYIEVGPPLALLVCLACLFLLF
jgi:hypothetical protein